jgi:predicted  nucleic acid-binding Zn-ribbon protein
MEESIKKRINEISQEISSLHEERLRLSDQQKEIDVKLHQLIGALYELQKLIDHQ